MNDHVEFVLDKLCTASAVASANLENTTKRTNKKTCNLFCTFKQQNGELQPKHDHGTGSEDGWYVTANSAFGTAGAATLLYSDKRVSRLSGDCYLEAWFYCSSLCLMKLLAYDYADASLVPLNERHIWISLGRCDLFCTLLSLLQNCVLTKGNSDFALKSEALRSRKGLAGCQALAMKAPPATQHSCCEKNNNKNIRFTK